MVIKSKDKEAELKEKFKAFTKDIEVGFGGRIKNILVRLEKEISSSEEEEI